jgi:hypothetical protein
MKKTALLLGGIGLFLLGISATVYVFRGPPKTGQEKYMEAIAKQIEAGNHSTQNFMSKSETEKNQETIEKATLILYGKSSIKGNEHITVFDKVLWGDLENPPSGVLGKHTVEENHNYGDGAIFFYEDGKVDHNFSSWAVYDGRIPAWENKDISELIDHIKKTK